MSSLHEYIFLIISCAICIKADGLNSEKNVIYDIVDNKVEHVHRVGLKPIPQIIKQITKDLKNLTANIRRNETHNHEKNYTLKAMKVIEEKIAFFSLPSSAEKNMDIFTFHAHTWNSKSFEGAEENRKNQCNSNEPPPQYQAYNILFDNVFANLTNLITYHNQSIEKIFMEHTREENVEEVLDKMNKNIMKTKRGLIRYYEAFSNYMLASDLNTVIENCDADQLQRGENFIELEKVFQIVVFPRFEMIAENLCKGKGEEMPKYCSECKGQLKDCKRKHSINYCAADKNSSRSYEWISIFKETNIFYGPLARGFDLLLDVTYGDSSFCHRKTLYIANEPQVCKCEQSGKDSDDTISTISSEMAKSDIKKNMVITGVKFTLRRGIIYTQIKQGKLIRGGSIKKNTDSWKPVHRFRSHAEFRTDRFKSATEFNSPIIINNDVKNINLDDVNCPEYHVVTGVRLKEDKNASNVSVVALAIRCHRIDFETGLLDITDIENERMQFSRLHSKRLDIGGLPPNRVGRSNHSDSNTDQYVEIQMSGLSEDAGQSVIPWFDAQNVTSSIALPLSGVGLYHRGAPHSGGFLAYRVFSMNYTSFF